MTAGATETEATPPLTRAGRAVGLLAAEGGSVALALWFIGARGHLPSLVYNNTLPPASRKLAMAMLLAGAALAAGGGLVAWVRRGAAGLDAIDRVARRLAPLCLAALVPLLFHWQLWTESRAITFAALAS